MKNLPKFLTLALFLITFQVTQALAQFVVTADENGNGTFTPPGGPTMPMPFGLAPDPFSGTFTLFYQLPFPTVAGDLLLLEPGNPQPSDIIRFDGQGRMFFFSLIDDAEPPDLADVPLLPVPLPNNFIVPEIGPEGMNGAVYMPLPGQPGFTPIGPITYNILSDVPEPGVSILSSLGGAVLLALNWRRRAKRT